MRSVSAFGWDCTFDESVRVDCSHLMNEQATPVDDLLVTIADSLVPLLRPIFWWHERGLPMFPEFGSDGLVCSHPELGEWKKGVSYFGPHRKCLQCGEWVPV